MMITLQGVDRALLTCCLGGGSSRIFTMMSPPLLVVLRFEYACLLTGRYLVLTTEVLLYVLRVVFIYLLDLLI
jgi:hypothetical protein